MRLAGKVALVTDGGGGIGRATAQLFAREGAIAPGWTLSERVLSRQGSRTPDDLKGNTHLLGRITPEEMARSVLYLASEDSVKTTGHILVVDSGLTIQ